MEKTTCWVKNIHQDNQVEKSEKTNELAFLSNSRPLVEPRLQPKTIANLMRLSSSSTHSDRTAWKNLPSDVIMKPHRRQELIRNRNHIPGLLGGLLSGTLRAANRCKPPGRCAISSCPAALRKNAVWTYESCQISFDEMFIFGENYEYSSLKFADVLDLITNKIIWEIGRQIFKKFPKNWWFARGNLATPEGSYGVFP